MPWFSASMTYNSNFTFLRIMPLPVTLERSDTDFVAYSRMLISTSFTVWQRWSLSLMRIGILESVSRSCVPSFWSIEVGISVPLEY